MTTKITLTNIDSTGDYSELVDAAYNTANAASSYANAAFAVLEMAVKSNDGPVGDVTPKDPFELLNTRPPMLIEPEPTKRE